MHENLESVFGDTDKYLCINTIIYNRKIVMVIYDKYEEYVGKLKEVVKIDKKNNLKLIHDVLYMNGTYSYGVCSKIYEEMKSLMV